MSRSDPARVLDYLEHIVQAVSNIDEYTADMDESAYLADRKTQDAVVRNFEVIGEACNNVAKHHAQFAKDHPQVPWVTAYEMRNALAHGYFKVDQALVWRTIHADLASLRSAIESLLNSLRSA